MLEEEKQFIFRLDERVDAISERIASLEGQLKKTNRKGLKQHLSEYGGIFALALSIVIGTFTVYDKIVVQPSDSFRKDIENLVKLSSQISSLDWADNPIAAQAQAQSLTPQRIALIEKIERFGTQHPNKLLFTDRLMLVNENEVFFRYEKALEHANWALKASKEPIQVANANWAIARINGQLNRLADMRIQYDKAANQFVTMGLNLNAAAVMQLYTQWVYFELIKNETCTPANKVFTSMVAAYQLPEVWPVTKQATYHEFFRMISNAPKSCNLVLPRIY